MHACASLSKYGDLVRGKRTTRNLVYFVAPKSLLNHLQVLHPSQPCLIFISLQCTGTQFQYKEGTRNEGRKGEGETERQTGMYCRLGEEGEEEHCGTEPKFSENKNSTNINHYRPIKTRVCGCQKCTRDPCDLSTFDF